MSRKNAVLDQQEFGRVDLGEAAAKLKSRNAILPLTDIFMTSSKSVIVKDPEIMHGTPVFRGTRVPIQALFDYLEGGETLEEFLEGFPTVSREMAVAALEQAKDFLCNSAVTRP